MTAKAAPPPKPRIYWATGRRKNATARVRLFEGSGQLTINDMKAAEYLQRPTLEMLITEPLEATQSALKYDVICNVHGGGKAGQAGAIRLGIARALVEADESARRTLRKGPFLTRDSRMKERKKYGQKGARKRFQYSKR